ncbi:MAG: four helix bundle protein [Bacteroidales bacterium]|nr:four helix bundle protein [Bacteroidales bacterium]
MSEIGDKIQEKCVVFGDKVIKLNDFLLEQECRREEERHKRTGGGRIPIHLKSVANLSNQLLRSGTSIGANNAEAINAISKADFRSKSFIALKEARESLYWINLLHRNNYIDKDQYEFLYTDCEELVKILVHRCKKLEENNNKN